MNFKLAAAFGIALVVGCEFQSIDFAGNGLAHAEGGNGGGGAGGSGAKECLCTAEDGSRLSAQWIVGDDGSRMHSGMWLDSEMGDSCSYQSLANGETRCVPLSTVVNSFADSACTKPIYILKDCGEKPKYIRTETRDFANATTCGFDGNGDAILATNVIDIYFSTVDYGSTTKGPFNWYSIDDIGACKANGSGSSASLVQTYDKRNVSWFVKDTRTN